MTLQSIYFIKRMFKVCRKLKAAQIKNTKTHNFYKYRQFFLQSKILFRT